MTRNRRTLLVLCIVLGVLAAFNAFDNARVVGEVLALTFATTCVTCVFVLDELIMALLVTWGIRLWRSEEADNTDLVNVCESLALASAGLRVVDLLVDALAIDALYRDSVMSTLVTLATIVAYYLTVRQLERSSFWSGVRSTDRPDPLLPAEFGTRELTLDDQTGMVRPVHDGEEATVVVVSEAEHLEVLPGRVMEQVAQSLGNVRHCSCMQLNDKAFGSVHVPREVQRAAGFDAGEDINFSFQADGERLVLVADEDTPARSFLAMCLVDQYMEKEAPVGLIPETSMIVAVRVSHWLRDYGMRLMLLEERIGEVVYELPQGFTEFVGDARRELNVVYGFCKQMGDMLGDLREIVERCSSPDAAQPCSVVSRQFMRLATDASEMRELAGEVRVGFQERIELRQNKVISMLTIVTTVFTPLALVTGWYGMNFTNMPELKLRDAYFIVAIIMVMVIALEFAYFKRRRWF